MQLTNTQVVFVLIFFIYGLAFFSMGLALMLETSRSPRLAERRILRPLAVFGLLHGVHEWIEIIFLQGIWLSTEFPFQLAAGRVFWLAISFLPLVVFAVITFTAPCVRSRIPAALGFGCLAAYLVSALVTGVRFPEDLLARMDALARYLLAVPGGLLAGWALEALGRRAAREGRVGLARRFTGAALGFALYGITQLFVSPASFWPANWLNAGAFQAATGFPVQIVRAAAAVWITYCLLQAIQIVEREREKELHEAQKGRLEALERVQRELVEREALRSELLRHIVLAQEDERARIARELHDEAAQLLTGFSLNLAALRDSVPANPQLQELVARLQDLSREISQRIYRLIHDLRPAQLDDLGLVPALRSLAGEERKRTGLNVTVSLGGRPRRLDSVVETVFYRVAQEALSNTARHSGAETAEVALIFTEQKALLRVCDSGSGFDPLADLRPPKGWGLAGMRERAESIGAIFRLQSAPGQGTVVEVEVDTGKTAVQPEVQENPEP